MQKKDGVLSPIKAVDSMQVSPINNILNSAFEHIEVRINGLNISHRSGNHAYKSYMKTKCSFGQGAVDTWGTLALFKKDSGAEGTSETFNDRWNVWNVWNGQFGHLFTRETNTQLFRREFTIQQSSAGIRD